MTSASRRSSRRRSSASVVLGLLTGRRRSSQLAQIRPELVEATVAGVALRLSANQPVDDGDLDSLPQHDVVQKLCATLDDAFAALGHYSDQDGYAPFARLTPTNRGLKRFLERYDRLSPDEWTEQEAQAVEYAARAVAVAARAEARRVQREPGPALLELRRRFREGPLAHLERSVQHARTMASIADGSITSNNDASDRWDDVAARLGAVAARLRMIRCQRQLKAQQTLRDDLAATSKRAALARKRLKPLADAIAKRSNGVVSIPPTKSLWRMATLAGAAEASLDSDDAPYEAPTGEDGGETDEVPPHSLRVRRRAAGSQDGQATLADLARDPGFRLCSLPDVARARVTVATPSQLSRAILALEEADVASVVEGSDAAKNRVELVDCVDCLFGESTTPGTVFFHFRFVDDDGATAFVCELQLCLGQLVTDDWRSTAAFDAYRSAREFLIATGKGDLVDAVESEERKTAATSEAPAPAPPEAPAPRRSLFRFSRGSRDAAPRRRSSVLNAVAAALGRRGSVQPHEDSDDDDEPVLEAEAPPA